MCPLSIKLLLGKLDLHISRQEELIELFNDRGEPLPFTVTDDERRMTSELINAMREPAAGEGEKRHFGYSRTAGSGLRVPDHTDYRGDALNGAGGVSISPDAAAGAMAGDVVDQGQFWDDDDDGSGDIDFVKEDPDEYMELS